MQVHRECASDFDGTNLIQFFSMEDSELKLTNKVVNFETEIEDYGKVIEAQTIMEEAGSTKISLPWSNLKRRAGMLV